ncbi:iron-siderophore ABC transporter substrate-binding protein [Nocardioides caldifontis]|uniref:iron-siderophore ABC transporter substrate-binding protein n=1 Tax=Nocardioides caldifontis TaxID=2588938 RepID=UPI0011DF6918|nr:iron-siderophore ABC transporter substrate-binding protein [Nocardioides caldifontis]
MTRLPLRRALGRRVGLPLAAAVSAVALAACSTTSTSDPEEGGSGSEAESAVDEDAFPVTIEHAFGETTIEEEPKRIATLGWVDQDHLLALGIVPVGALEISWGGNDQMSTPWFDEKLEELGGEQPTRYSDADGAPVEEIAKLTPDLILATNSGITDEEYKKLSKIAPVVAYPDDPWLTDWEDSLEMVGQATGRNDLADEVQEETEAALDQAAEDNPQIVGKSFIFAYLTTTDTSKIDFYLPGDARPDILVDLGMVNAPIIEELAEPGQFYGTVSAERAPEMESDVFITYAETDKDLETFTKDPLLGQIPAIKSGNVLASTDQTDALGMSSPSPLSLPYAMETFIPQVAAAVDGN